MTPEGAAGVLRCSVRTLHLVEGGRCAARGVQVRAMCERYEASPALTAALVGLAAETTATGWWHPHGGAVPEWFDLYARLAAGAGRLREYQELVVPELLQTPGYAALTLRGRPEEQAGRLLRARLRRQALLGRRLPAPPRVEVVLSEGVLWAGVDPQVLAGQLRHLLEVGRLPHVSVRVLPFAAGLHHGAVAGPFVLLEFPPGNLLGTEPPVVYQDFPTGALYLDHPGEWAAYQPVWGSLDALALDPARSRSVIDGLLREAERR
jgi:hypothetical protein